MMHEIYFEILILDLNVGRWIINRRNCLLPLKDTFMKRYLLNEFIIF